MKLLYEKLGLEMAKNKKLGEGVTPLATRFNLRNNKFPSNLAQQLPKLAEIMKLLGSSQPGCVRNFKHLSSQNVSKQQFARFEESIIHHMSISISLPNCLATLVSVSREGELIREAEGTPRNLGGTVYKWYKGAVPYFQTFLTAYE